MLIDFEFKLEVTLPKFRKRMDKKQSIFKVTLTKVGEARLPVVKAVFKTVKLSLKEAKDAVDNAPTVLGETASEKEAYDLKKKIEAASKGTEVTVEVK